MVVVVFDAYKRTKRSRGFPDPGCYTKLTDVEFWFETKKFG
jgi:hypothetical protein